MQWKFWTELTMIIRFILLVVIVILAVWFLGRYFSLLKREFLGQVQQKGGGDGKIHVLGIDIRKQIIKRNISIVLMSMSVLSLFVFLFLYFLGYPETMLKKLMVSSILVFIISYFWYSGFAASKE